MSGSYAADVEVILALISYLGLTNKRKRTPAKIAKHVGIDERRVLGVLERYPGLFRRSLKVKDEGHHSFSLQVRHASRYLEEPDEDSTISDPLGADYFGSLMQYVLSRKKSEEELNRVLTETRVTRLAAWIAAGSALLAAGIVAYAQWGASG